MRALLLALALAGALRAETCAELAERVQALRNEIGRIERDGAGAEARQLECQAAAGAAFAERREMKQATTRARWESASWRLAIALQLIPGTLAGNALTRPQGDPQRPVDDAVNAVRASGVWTLAQGGAAKVDALLASASASRSPPVHQAAVAALRELLELRDAVGLSAEAPADPLSGEKLTRKFADADALFDDPALAAHKPRGAALDAALATLELALEHERRPSENARDAAERKRQELAAAQARLAACTGR